MANDSTGNPWKLDTAATISTSPVFVKYMRWTPTTDGDDLLVVNNAGDYVWSIKAIAADSNQAIDYKEEINGWVNGFIITTIDNGTLYVHIK